MQRPFLEGLVPGLDMCNHHEAAQVQWTVFGSSAAAQKQVGDAVFLVAPPGWRPGASQEVFINYGMGRCNEELLFTHGFCREPSELAHERALVKCPLPPQESWDEAMQERWGLLHMLGLSPAVMLPGELVAQRGGLQAVSQLPEDAVVALALLAMPGPQLKVASHHLDLLHEDVMGGKLEMGEVRDAFFRHVLDDERAVVRALDLLVQLLQLQARELAAGTGSAAEDEELLRRDAASEREARKGGARLLAPHVRSMVVYRLGQKKLVHALQGQCEKMLEKTAQGAKMKVARG